MADNIKIGFEFDDGNLVEGLDRGISRLENFDKAFQDLSKKDTFEEIGESINDFDKELNDSINSVANAEKQHKKLTDEVKKYDKSLTDTIKDQKIFGVSINDVTAKFNAKKKALTGVVSSLKNGTKGLQLFRVALAATGVGAIVIALGSLVALLTRTQKGLDFVSKITASASAAFDVLIDRASTAGSALVALFTGDFEGAANLAKQAVSGVADEIIRESQAAAELEQRNQNLRDSRLALNIEYAKSQAQIEELRNLSRDETKSRSEREAAIEKALELESQLEAKRIENAKENLDIIKQQNALGESLQADLEAEAQAEIELFNIQSDTSRKRRRDLQQIQALRKQAAAEAKAQQEAEQARIKAINDELTKQIGILEGRVATIEFEGLDEFEKLAKERELAIQEVQKLQSVIEETAAAAGKQVDITDDIQALFDAIEQEYQRGFNKLAGVEGLETISLDPIAIKAAPFDNTDLVDKLSSSIISATDDAELTVKDKLEKFTANIAEALGIDKETLNELVGLVGGALSSIADGIVANTELQISQQDEIISQLDSRIDATEQALDRELELKKAGYANDFDLLKGRLEEEQKQRDEATSKRLALEKKAARQRLAIESIQQVSALSLSVANVILNESKFGLAGIIAAAAGVTSLFAIFKKNQALAKSSVEVPELRTGLNPFYETKGKPLTIQGRTHEQGGEWYLQGERAYKAEKDEIIMPTAASREHHGFLYDVGRGKYKGVDLSNLAQLALPSRRRLTRNVQQIAASREKIAEYKRQNELQTMEKAYKKAALKSAKYIVEGNRKNQFARPHKNILPDGRIREEYYNEAGDLIRVINREIS